MHQGESLQDQKKGFLVFLHELLNQTLREICPTFRFGIYESLSLHPSSPYRYFLQGVGWGWFKPIIFH